MLREELRRIVRWEERHRRLVARLFVALGLSAFVTAIGSLLIWHYERGAKGSDIHGYGDALFFTLVQVLTISSSLKNPLTAAGKAIDVVLEAWAVFVVTAMAGSFAAFFRAGDSG